MTVSRYARCASARSATSRSLLLVPVGLVFYRTFEHGVGPAWDAVTTPEAMHAL